MISMTVPADIPLEHMIRVARLLGFRLMRIDVDLGRIGAPPAEQKRPTKRRSVSGGSTQAAPPSKSKPRRARPVKRGVHWGRSQ